MASAVYIRITTEVVRALRTLSARPAEAPINRDIDGLVGRVLELTTIRPREAVSIYKVRGVTATEAGLVTHGHKEFVEAMERAGETVYITTTKVDNLMYVILFSTTTSEPVAWMVIEDPGGAR